MASRVRLPEGLGAVYNLGLVFVATIGLMMAFLLSLQRYTKNLEEAAALAVPAHVGGQVALDPLIKQRR